MRFSVSWMKKRRNKRFWFDRILKILKRNKCEFQIIEPAGDVETKILKEILRKIEAIRLGLSEPKELEDAAVNTIARFSLINLSDDVSEILHDCIDFAEHPLLSDLKEIEDRARKVLSKKLAVS